MWVKSLWNSIFLFHYKMEMGLERHFALSTFAVYGKKEKALA